MSAARIPAGSDSAAPVGAAAGPARPPPAGGGRGALPGSHGLSLTRRLRLDPSLRVSPGHGQPGPVSESRSLARGKARHQHGTSPSPDWAPRLLRSS